MTHSSDAESAEAAPIVEVRQAVIDDLLAHARQEAPFECCGILVGTGGRIVDSRRARNLLQSTTRYLIDPEAQFAAMRFARERELAVVGFYHSHPASGPAPSETDTSEAAYPGHWYLIVGPGNQQVRWEVRGYVLQKSGNFLPITLVPTP